MSLRFCGDVVGMGLMSTTVSLFSHGSKVQTRFHLCDADPGIFKGTFFTAGIEHC